MQILVLRRLVPHFSTLCLSCLSSHGRAGVGLAQRSQQAKRKLDDLINKFPTLPRDVCALSILHAILHACCHVRMLRQSMVHTK